MKKNRIFGLAAAAFLLGAGACSNDVIEPDKNHGGQLTPSDGSGGVYMTLDITMPGGSTGTRSKTTADGGSTGGVEVGSEAENHVSSALIVLASTVEKDTTIDKVRTKIDKFGFIVAGEVPGNRISTLGDGANNKQYRAVARLQQENLNSLYGLYEFRNKEGELILDDNGGIIYKVPQMYVFVFCNPTQELLTLFDGENTPFGSSEWIDKTCEVIQTVDASQSKNIGIWGTNSFLMNNVSLTTRRLPEKLLDWEYYSSPTEAFHLSQNNNTVKGVDKPVNNGKVEADEDPNNEINANRGAVRVERSVARFDFKDGSPLYAKDKDADNVGRYNVLYNTKENGDLDEAQPIVDIKIQKMCLVNMCNKFYYVPRVSDNGLEEHTIDADGKYTNGFAYCGVEKPWERNGGIYSGGNYVVGPYASEFGGDAIMTDFQKYMNFPFFDENGTFNTDEVTTTRWDVVKVSDVLNGHPDNYTGQGSNPAITATEGTYKVWRYVTENVIPVNQGKQVNGISTGVVFKGKLSASHLATKEAADIAKAKEENIKEEDLPYIFYQEAWNKGNISNLANCLNGNTFIYNGKNHVLSGKAEDDPILYYYDGHIYMGWRHIRQAAIQASVTINTAGQMEINTSNNLYKVVFGDGPIPTYTTIEDGKEVEHKMIYVDADGAEKEINDPRWEAYKKGEADDKLQDAEWETLKTAYKNSPNYAWSVWAEGDQEKGDDSSETGENTGVSEKLKKMRLAITGAGVAIYQSSDDDEYGPGYYCYYYYWNRHNDNGVNTSMGPMEFDVVRNNVYKLSIQAISKLGHPRIPQNDPDSPEPDDPDESDEIYMDVNVEIVPWVVRLNNIIF